MSTSQVYVLRRRRRRPSLGRAFVVAVAVAAVSGGVAPLFDAPTPAARHVVVHQVVAPGVPAGQASLRPGAVKVPKVHVLRSLYVLHRLVRVHRLFYVRRYRRRWLW